MLKTRESSTYQAILAEAEAIGEAKGKATEARRLVMMMGEKRFGTPTIDVLGRLDRVTSREQWEVLATRLLETETWDELLAN